jgi:beta-glucanase (GH16 family)
MIRQHALAVALIAGLLSARTGKAEPEITTVSPTAPKLDLTGYKLVFNEEFNKKLDVSARGPGTRWIAHTPWNGDFGDAGFSDPAPGFPFTVKDGMLRIEAKQNDKGKWRSGLLASNTPKGDGFSLQYGYFEISMKLPAEKGVWPAFWLSTSSDKTNPHAADDGAIEIDVIEFYGFAEAYSSGIHIWKPEPHHGYGATVRTPKHDTAAFHTYGVLVTPEWITMYRDRRQVWKTATPKEHKRPLMILLNLALGGGWPIDKVKDPTYMLVDYVRAYERKTRVARAPDR